jgi:hypothetical protein
VRPGCRSRRPAAAEQPSRVRSAGWWQAR